MIALADVAHNPRALLDLVLMSGGLIYPGSARLEFRARFLPETGQAARVQESRDDVERRSRIWGILVVPPILANMFNLVQFVVTGLSYD